MKLPTSSTVADLAPATRRYVARVGNGSELARCADRRDAVMIRRVSWFDGASPRGDQVAEFLSALRAEAARWDLDVLPGHTSALTVLTPLYVDVDVPGLPVGTNKWTVLQGGYWARGPAGLVLQAEWGDSHLLDAGGDDEDLRIGGLAIGPAEAAALLASWFSAQLRRPVQRADWLDAADTVVASRWRLLDTGRTLAVTGPWRRRRRPPTRASLVRPSP